MKATAAFSIAAARHLSRALRGTFSQHHTLAQNHAALAGVLRLSQQNTLLPIKREMMYDWGQVGDALNTNTTVQTTRVISDGDFDVCAS